MKKTIVAIFSLLAAALCVSCAGSVTPADTTAATEPPKPVELPIYMDAEKGNDQNDGATDTTAVQTFERAFELLTEGRETIVFVTSSDFETLYPVLPEYDGTVVFTTTFDGVDYYEKNSAKFKIPRSISLNSDAVFRDIVCYTYAEDGKLCCNYHNVTIEESVTCVGSRNRRSLIYAGYFVPDVSLAEKDCPLARNLGHNGDCEITVLGGQWQAFCGGNYRVGLNSPIASYDGNLTVNIGGSADFKQSDPNDDLHAFVFSATGMNFQRGTVTLNITGGSFDGPLYAVGRRGTIYNKTADNDRTGTDGTQQGRNVTYTADVTVNISGGSFTAACTEICALRNPGETPLTGAYTLNITGGSFAAAPKLSALGVLGTCTLTGAPADAKTVDFDSVNGTAVTEKKALRIACCGDSITWGTCSKDETIGTYTYDDENFSYPAVLQKLYGDSAVVSNLGYPGANVTQTAYSTYYNSSVYNLFEEFCPDVVILAIGTNNWSVLPASLDSVTAAYRTLLGAMHKKWPDAVILETTALYRYKSGEAVTEAERVSIDYIRPLQKKLADEYAYVVLYDAMTEMRPYANGNYFADGLHPNNTGYAVLAKVMKKGVDALAK